MEKFVSAAVQTCRCRFFILFFIFHVMASRFRERAGLIRSVIALFIVENVWINLDCYVTNESQFFLSETNQPENSNLY